MSAGSFPPDTAFGTGGQKLLPPLQGGRMNHDRSVSEVVD